MADESKQALQGAVDALLDIAEDLKEEKSGLMERIGANRDMLRNYRNMGVCTAKQNTDIDALYPKRERKPEEATATP